MTEPFGVYIHWPFCRSKCPYCDFNSHVRETVDQDRWRNALLSEIDHFASLAPERRVTSVFFGGGTPSLMPPETVAAAIDRLDLVWDLAPDVEITLEANPTSAEAARFAGFRAAGVNRISLGVQSLDDRALGFLGRQHDAGEALAAVELARRTVPRMSFDLIYARPDQSVDDWQRELDQALSFGPDHLSVYQLTIEPGTAFAAQAERGALTPLDAEPAADLYQATQEMLEAAGLPAYEVSNHARDGQACRHNLVYWRYHDYAGIGPGAHGRLTLNGTRFAVRQYRAPETWLARVEAFGHGSREESGLPPDICLSEAVMMGLRLTEGVDLDDLEARCGAAVDRTRLDPLREAGYLTVDGPRIATTAEGRLRLNALLEYLLS